MSFASIGLLKIQDMKMQDIQIFSQPAGTALMIGLNYTVVYQP